MKQAGAIVLLVFALQFAGAQSFSSIPSVAADSLRFERDLPAVEIKDAAGKVWRPEDFLGKYTLVYIFHTFEARTVDAHAGRGHDQLIRWAGLPDLREVQRFYDRAK